MKKLIAIFALLASVVVAGAQSLESATATSVFRLQSVAANTSYTSTNFAAGPIYYSTNGVYTNAIISPVGPVMFVVNSTTVSTNPLTITLQESTDRQNWTNKFSFQISGTTAVYTNYNVRSLAHCWRATLASTNAAAAAANASVTAIWFNKYQ